MLDARGPPVQFELQAGEETKLQELTRHWMNERHAPDILPAQSVLLGRLLDHIRKQNDTVQLLRADPDSSEEEHFRIMLAQTEIERVKFIVRSYVRTRLYKIEKYARYIVATPEVQERLSETELQHARRYAHLVESHFHRTVLQSLPEEQRGLADETAFMPPMIPEPDKTRAVFAMARTNCPPVRLPDGSTSEMEKGQISLTPYYVVEQLLARGEVELV
ncbi:GINS complex, Sld5 component [Gloeophyllum trabeum ATCC 11539]|uniref:DNA replication complex GINS protein SLD5 n=1 Tax=Gloeophyllum trabeum (strain ATCC 11539 / FP-39264 / Madison 617) TaxID=670483 RepID=S7Q0J2_GLOTA|nr:GINS complex, Sld5 component [Gloeophyllum trabeum ATCC 11539]EPQ53238.1 GINS complex, Sld5 component [Gloeophyllum trabeum ATCC 11539]